MRSDLLIFSFDHTNERRKYGKSSYLSHHNEGGRNSTFLGHARDRFLSQVYHMLIADNTAKMNVSLFDCYGELLQPGDIVRLTGGYCSLYKVLHVM